MKITVLQAEGSLLYLGPKTYSEWEHAARHLREICRLKGDTLDYYKTDVTIAFDDGCIYRYRFDAQMAEISTTRDLAIFRENTLLWTKTVNRLVHTDNMHRDIVPDGWPEEVPATESMVAVPA